MGASNLPEKIAIGDWITALIALVCLGLLFHFEVNNPLLVSTAVVVGLVVFPNPAARLSVFSITRRIRCATSCGCDWLVAAELSNGTVDILDLKEAR